MYCPNCGAEIKDGAQFCGNCGKKIEIRDAAEKTESTSADEEVSQQTSEKTGQKGESVENDVKDTDSAVKDQPSENEEEDHIDKSRLSAFDKVAIRFTYLIADPVIGIVMLIPSMKLFQEGGFWGIAFGIIFLIIGIGYIVSGIKEWVDMFRGKSTIDDNMNKDSLKSCRKTLIIGAVVIVIGVAVIHSTGGGIYINVQNVVLDDFGSESIGTVVDDNIKNAKWSKDKLDSGTYRVYVTGYNKNYGNMKIEFYYEEDDGGSGTVQLNKITLLDDDETYDTKSVNGALSMTAIWSTFYSDDSGD